MAKNNIPQERWKRYETGPPAIRIAFTNAETAELPRLLEGIEADWPIMESLVANAHKTYEARHFEDRLRNMVAWYQWIEAYLNGEPIEPKEIGENPCAEIDGWVPADGRSISKGALQYIAADVSQGKSYFTEEMFRKSINEIASYKRLYQTQIYSPNEIRHLMGISP